MCDKLATCPGCTLDSIEDPRHLSKSRKNESDFENDDATVYFLHLGLAQTH